ncbi:MAG: hypothetical protein A3F91_13045 [Flavobacteria bacterium RIFCSPLOWO2_12_FULL_35_11]|nr:MAG: hypothetical protein A3F91_13045 [Flavobacteria bacterium RIFCSPLOWO2_12_FULL_35_11]
MKYLLLIFTLISLNTINSSIKRVSCEKEARVYEKSTEKKPKVKALLLHMTHYDPSWNVRKESEASFSLEAGLAILNKMKESGFNTVILDIEDGVIYKSHPELTRHYSVPMDELKQFADSARELGIDFIPKLNFSRSGRNLHDKWLYPHWDELNFVSNRADYRKVALEVMEEIISVCKPQNYFHIGMDEDHHRSLNQYVETIIFFDNYLKNKGLQTVVWNDTAYENRDVIAQVHADKMKVAEPDLPKYITHIVWDYDLVHQGLVQRLTDFGFEVWVAPGDNLERIEKWDKVMKNEGGDGFLFTKWIKCSDENREILLNQIDRLKFI